MKDNLLLLKDFSNFDALAREGRVMAACQDCCRCEFLPAYLF